MTNATQFAVGQRVRVSHGHVGTIERVYSDGLAYLFRADSGAVFTVHWREVDVESAPPMKAPPALAPNECRTVFRIDRAPRPHDAPGATSAGVRPVDDKPAARRARG